VIHPNPARCTGLYKFALSALTAQGELSAPFANLKPIPTESEYHQNAFEDRLGSWKKINPQILRKILVRIQGASNVAYFRYSTFGATRNTGQKTSKIVDLFFSMTLYT
jgi:hypothetical protein